MKSKLLIVLAFSWAYLTTQANDPLNYSITLEPVIIDNLEGIQSYVFAQHNDKWLIIGGRKDGLHARSPIESFPASHNNTEIRIINPYSREFIAVSVNSLPTHIAEQLQSTNLNFFQLADTLVMIGGYGYSATANNHITHPRITTLIVSQVIKAIEENKSISPFIQSLYDERFAISGGQLGKIGDTFYLVGGHRFDGRYNPFGGPSFTQTYATEYKTFKINNQEGQLSYSDFNATVDQIHLRRRDYNLVPQIFPDGKEGYMISSGVFQINVDLPFLYPVDITADGYTARTEFNQFLSNYHSPKAAVHDASLNRMHSIFFGGLSQYYYQNGTLIKDDAVPFVKTISMITRFEDNSLQEYKLPLEMPGLKGTGAEFIPNRKLPHNDMEIILIHEIPDQEFVLGHIFGGITSPSLNPFTVNQTSTTFADPTIYAVKLTKNLPSGALAINGSNPLHATLYPNPFKEKLTMEIILNQPMNGYFFISDVAGQILHQGELNHLASGTNQIKLIENPSWEPQLLMITIVLDNKYFINQKVTFQP